MESLGKEFDLDGNKVEQGLAVYGNKGSSDQHSYVQQLLGGPGNFFVIFIEVLRDREQQALTVGEGSTSGDYLQAFLLGTRQALASKGRASVTITVPEVSEQTVGGLIALWERTVGYYAYLIGVNAYDQPAVEMGKKSAGEIIALKNRLTAEFRQKAGQAFTVEQLAEALGTEDVETLFKLLRHLAANAGMGIKASGSILTAQYVYEGDV
jgi:glucose-6-phosphate isomerase